MPTKPPPPPFDHIADLQIIGNERNEVLGSEDEKPTSSVGVVTRTTWLSVAGLIFLWVYGNRLYTRLREYLRFKKLKKDVQRRFVLGDGAANDDGDEGDDEEAAAAADATVGDEEETTWGGKKVQASRAGQSVVPELCLQLPDGSTQEISFDLSRFESMKQVQAKVLQEWTQAGGDRRESLMMEYIGQKGNVVKVTKTTDIRALKAAASLNLMPTRWRKKKANGSTYGQLQQDADEPRRTAPLERAPLGDFD